ncbi:MAG: glutathione peroxidase [Sphingobacteriia bacterium]|nr:glutathione peroxidase [Bacteroidota bacterium]NBW42380.1 glutathione peroxidase [Sphingobacteriia bacterium]
MRLFQLWTRKRVWTVSWIVLGSFGLGFYLFSCVQAASPPTTTMDFYQLKALDLEGKTISFDAFRGRKVLLVNTATGCGLAPQLKDLQNLQNRYKGRLLVVGIPTNDFIGQEPLDGAQISEHCLRNYGVEFLMLAKGTLRGAKKDPVLEWLTSKQLNGAFSTRIWWNYQKYLVDEKGRLIDWFSPWTSPNASRLIRQIEKP